MAWLPVLAPYTLSEQKPPFEAFAHSDVAVSSDRLAVLVVSSCLMRAAARHYVLMTSTKVKVVCIRGKSACMCCKEATCYNLWLKINNFVTQDHFIKWTELPFQERPNIECPSEYYSG